MLKNGVGAMSRKKNTLRTGETKLEKRAPPKTTYFFVFFTRPPRNRSVLGPNTKWASFFAKENRRAKKIQKIVVQKQQVLRRTRKCSVLDEDEKLRGPKLLASWSVYKICKNPGKYTRTSAQNARARAANEICKNPGPQTRPK